MVWTCRDVLCSVVMDVLPDDRSPGHEANHDVAFTTEQCQVYTDEEGIQHPNLPAWCDELPVDYFINPFYGISRDRVDAFLQEMLDREEEEYEAGWREVPYRNRERRRKPQRVPKVE
jgi:hypothetical protein